MSWQVNVGWLLGGVRSSLAGMTLYSPHESGLYISHSAKHTPCDLPLSMQALASHHTRCGEARDIDGGLSLRSMA